MSYTVPIKSVHEVSHDVKAFLSDRISDFDQPFYVCGPEPFNDAIMGYLRELGAEPESLVFEE